MSSTLYWAFLVLVVLVLAYITPFGFLPLVFLAGGAVLGFGYMSFLSFRRRRSGVWEHGTYQFRFVGSIFFYVALFWTTVGIFDNVKEKREFVARYEPYIQDGQQHGYTFYYVDHADCYERIDSPDLNQYLREKNPERVRLVLEIVKDFGRLRAYSVQTVESIPVTVAWLGGSPPWAVLRAE